MTQNCDAKTCHNDSKLLQQFIDSRDETAFRMLVEKYSGLVWSVCSRQLRFAEDREDAYQSTFVTLARKAKTIRSGTALSSWLYKVAYRSALSVAQTRSRHTDQSIVEDPEVVDNTFAKLRDREQAMILDEEVNRLPQKLRSVVVLCCLEGKSRKEAAEELACSEATIKSRLARGRSRLQMRLARRGIGLTVVLAAVTAFSEDAAAQVPQRLIDAAVSCGVATTPDPPITSLTESISNSVSSIMSSPALWLILMATAGSVAMVRWSVPNKVVQGEATIELNQTVAAEDKLASLVVTLSEEANPKANDPRANYLRIQKENYETLARAKQLELEAWLSSDPAKRGKLANQSRELKHTASQKLDAATRLLVEFAVMKGLWGEDEATSLIADLQIESTEPETNHAAVIAKMAQRARRFERPDDPDPVLSQIEEAPLERGNPNESLTESRQAKPLGGE